MSSSISEWSPEHPNLPPLISNQILIAQQKAKKTNPIIFRLGHSSAVKPKNGVDYQEIRTNVRTDMSKNHPRTMTFEIQVLKAIKIAIEEALEKERKSIQESSGKINDVDDLISNFDRCGLQLIPKENNVEKKIIQLEKQTEKTIESSAMNLLFLQLSNECSITTTPHNDTNAIALKSSLKTGDLMFVPSSWNLTCAGCATADSAALLLQWENTHHADQTALLSQPLNSETETKCITSQGRLRIGITTNWREQAVCAYCASFHDDETQCPHCCKWCKSAQHEGNACPRRNEFEVLDFSTKSVIGPSIMPMSNSNI